MTDREFSLLTEIIARSNEYAQFVEPVDVEVVTLLRRGYLRIIDHRGKAALRPTESGRRAVSTDPALFRKPIEVSGRG